MSTRVKRSDVTGGAVGGAAVKKLRSLKAPRIKVRVLQEHIDVAVPKNSGHCMISDAVKLAAPWASSISSDVQTIRVTDRAKGLRYIYLTPRTPTLALIAFDQGKKPKPFSFQLGNAHITTSYKRTKKPDGSTGRVAAQKLGPRRVSPRGMGVPDVVGGKPPPRGVPLRGGVGFRREFGLRAYVGDFETEDNPMPAGGPAIADR